MKCVILTAVFISGSIIASAQSTTGASGRSSATNTKSSKTKSSKVSDRLNNRKNYSWKNGQQATPTGQEATSSNGSGYSSLKKDTGSLRRKEKQ